VMEEVERLAERDAKERKGKGGEVGV